jgi:Transcription factor WhiB
MSEIISNPPIQPITSFRRDDVDKLITPNYYKSVLPQIERIIITNAACKGMGSDIFVESRTSESNEKNKEAIALCNECVVKDLCRNWAIAEILEGVVVGGLKTSDRLKIRDSLRVTEETREGEVEPAKVVLIRHALNNRARYLGMLSADDLRISFF